MERSDINCLSEFDPTPRYSVAALRSNWVWGSIRAYNLCSSATILGGLHKLCAH